jgi:cleavage and polyadenylation specificity factor subunit 3
LLILNEYWQEHEELKNIPIYYAGSLAQKSLSVFRTYRNMMGDAVRKKVGVFD